MTECTSIRWGTLLEQRTLARATTVTAEALKNLKDEVELL